MDLLTAAQQFIAIDSSPAQGCVEAAKWAAELCREIGLDVELQEEVRSGVAQANVIARWGEMSRDELMLQAHLDTRDPGSFTMWSRTENNPFNATIYDGRLYGLGAAGAKIDFLCKLKAMSQFVGRSLRCPLVLVGTHGAEDSMSGAVQVIRHKKVLARRAFVGAPTQLHVFHAAKGTVGVEIAIPFSKQEKKFRFEHDHKEGTSSQSRMFMGESVESMNENESNAVLKMLRYLAQLPEGLAVLNLDGGVSKNTCPSFASLEFDIVDAFEESMARRIRQILWAIEQVEGDFENYEDLAFDPPQAQLNIGMIRTQPEYVVISGLCHVPPAVEKSVYEGWMQVLREACEKVEASFRITEYFQPFRTPLGSEIVKASVEELGQLDLDFSPGACAESQESNIFSRFGVECVLFGAGQAQESKQTHDESVSIEDLQKAVLFYQNVIERLCV